MPLSCIRWGVRSAPPSFIGCLTALSLWLRYHYLLEQSCLIALQQAKGCSDNFTGCLVSAGRYT